MCTCVFLISLFRVIAYLSTIKTTPECFAGLTRPIKEITLKSSPTSLTFAELNILIDSVEKVTSVKQRVLSATTLFRVSYINLCVYKPWPPFVIYPTKPLNTSRWLIVHGSYGIYCIHWFNKEGNLSKAESTTLFRASYIWQARGVYPTKSLNTSRWLIGHGSYIMWPDFRKPALNAGELNLYYSSK